MGVTVKRKFPIRSIFDGVETGDFERSDKFSMYEIRARIRKFSDRYNRESDERKIDEN